MRCRDCGKPVKVSHMERHLHIKDDEGKITVQKELRMTGHFVLYCGDEILGTVDNLSMFQPPVEINAVPKVPSNRIKDSL